jgi:Fe-S cluster assembly protein SufD
MHGGAAARERVLSAFRALEDHTRAGTPAWLERARRAAIERFAATGFPTTRDEDWRYTNVAAIEATPLQLAPDGVPGVADDVVSALSTDLPSWRRLVFVNGRHVPGRSGIRPISGGGRLLSLTEAILTDADLVQSQLTELPGPSDGRDGASPPACARGGFDALNAAFWQDGVLLHVPAGMVVDEPLELLFVTTTGETAVASHPLNLIILERGSQATVVERYVTVGDAASLTNVTTTARIGAGATLQHHRIQQESGRAYHVGRIRVRQERDSTFSMSTITFGGRLTRNDVQARLDDAGAVCALNGLFVVGGRQHVDTHTVIDHASPHGQSRQLYKGVLDGNARGVFDGRVIVRPGAQKTDAHQTTKNLLLSDGVEVDSKPQLEIFADDVKCSHGAADGQLAGDAIFYLRSRGLSEGAARALLTYGFASEVLGRIPVAALRTRLECLLAARLRGGRVTEESA